MLLSRSFWSRSALITSIGTLLVLLNEFISSAVAGGLSAESVSSALRDLPQTFALLFSICTFAGGVASSDRHVATHSHSSRNEQSHRPLLPLILESAAVGVLILLVTGFGAPLLSMAIEASGLASGSGSVNTITGWYAEYARLQEMRAAGEPTLAWMVPVAGINFAIPLVAAVVGALSALLGALVGMRTAHMTKDAARAHQWTVAALTLCITALAARLAIALAMDHDMSPIEAMMIVPVVPALITTALAWVRVTEMRTRNVQLA